MILIVFKIIVCIVSLLVLNLNIVFVKLLPIVLPVVLPFIYSFNNNKIEFN